jgi:DNA helicase-2/ATP-dependent DNA helicase PcrA
MLTTPEFEKAYTSLNPEQKKAVDTIDGPVMVIAGPGTGKTQVLALRVGNILKHTDIGPGNILCLTFTDAAAVNMRERLSVLIGSAGYKVGVHTFHGFAREIIASYPEHFYNGADFIAADDLTQLEILEGVFADIPRTDPLSVMHEGEYTYLRDAKRAIGLLKQAGLTPKEFSDIITRNEQDLPAISLGLNNVFADRLSQKSIEDAALLAKQLAEGEVADNGASSLTHVVAASLVRAVKTAQENEKTAPLSAWKEKWAKKDDDGKRVLKDALYIGKMQTLAQIYKQYRERMYEQKYYDFDDMLLDVVEALSERPSLLSSLEERYQYILVDEFQDTNDAQLRLIRLLGSAPVNEGLPNIMIVGDDDQAIYRFQGAEISNILDFPKHFRGHALVVLTKNYRSTQHILDVAREVIEKSEERLEKVLPMLEKKLISSRPELGAGHILHALLPTRTHEHAYIASEVKRLIASGADPREIAIIARRHRELEDIARVMVAAGIPITYERKQNVFEEPHIRMLISMAQFVASLVRSGKKEADQYLPEILTAPFFGIPREMIWEISVAAGARSDHTWLGAMREHKDARVSAIAKWFIELGARSHHEPLERVLDELIGTDGVLLPSDVPYEHEESITPLPATTVLRSFKSPFREYYFGGEARVQNESRYLLFLSSLRVFVGALREYKKGKQLSIDDLVEFTALHERNGILLSDTTPFASSTSAVNLMTAHKAKGLEFDTVFVVSCQEDVWAGRGFPNKLPFPMNLPIERDEGGDDRLRIFYVALTRAKRHLYVTAYEKDDAGKSSLKVSFIAPECEGGSIATHLAESTAPMSTEDLIGSITNDGTHPAFYPIVPGERAILLALVKDYRMSVTHLNNFLDVTKGGPALFLEQNLLRFPQAMNPSSAYGSAMHKAIELFYRELKKAGHIPTAKTLCELFRFALERERMTDSEFRHFLDAGEAALSMWWKEQGKNANETHRSEVDFKTQGVVIGDTPLSGKIDKMVPVGSEMLVYDFKTGKAKTDWEGKDARAKITLFNYKRQLVFYKLLVEHSHDFNGYRVNKGVLEFLEPVNGKIAELAYDITDEDAKHLIKLIGVVHKKILALDFPDTSEYAKDLSGIMKFEDDLLEGRV